MAKPPRTASRSGIVTLLTDFGTSDNFAGVMKGVIASIAPEVSVVDITHDILPQQVKQGRWVLGQSWRWFPRGTVHVAVVDPGVGTERRALAVEAAGHFFVGPDNGLLSDAVRMEKAKVRQITNRGWMLKDVSATFHGRDVFAPVAARVASGGRFAAAGGVVADATYLGPMEPVRTGKRFWTGEVVHVDRFGNLITNLTPAGVPDLLARPAVFKAGFQQIAGLSATYGAGKPGEVIALIGSHGGVELSVNCGSAAGALGLVLGSPVDVEIL
ncbi:MAG: SAM-dependent chlorinase/fluorinase [Bryobacteraceae bacterium]|nr:SAM-dependent chlorinase/fluorinase [Bryobacteraceae bacterium]